MLTLHSLGEIRLLYNVRYVVVSGELIFFLNSTCEVFHVVQGGKYTRAAEYYLPLSNTLADFSESWLTTFPTKYTSP